MNFHCNMFSTQTIQRIIKNNKKYQFVNLSKENPYHHMFYDQMRIAQTFHVCPPIIYVYDIGHIKKIMFPTIKMINPYQYSFQTDDIHDIFSKYKYLFLHHRFIPKTPYLGYSWNENKQKKIWYIWSYTDIDFVDNQNEFIDKFYENHFHKDFFIEQYLLDNLLLHFEKNIKYLK